MLAFIDEAGDLGWALTRGSSPFYTVAIVTFDDSRAAEECQSAIERLRNELRIGPRSEFHFHGDSNARRTIFLEAVRRSRFGVHAFTLDKAAAQARPDAPRSYSEVCRAAIDSLGDLLRDARVVIDSSAGREFKRALAVQLRKEPQAPAARVREVALKRSSSDPLLQLADYCAGVLYALTPESVGRRRIWRRCAGG